MATTPSTNGNYPTSGMNTRIVGGGNTVMQVNGNNLLWLKTITETLPTPVAPAKAIQPLDAQYPVEIVYPNAIGEGTVTLSVIDVIGELPWKQFGDATGNAALSNAWDILTVLKAQRGKTDITMTKIVRNPDGTPNAARTRTYSGCVITDFKEGDTVNLETMEREITLTVMYLKYGNPNA